MPRIARPSSAPAPVEPEFSAEVDEFEEEGEVVEQKPTRRVARAADDDGEPDNPRPRARRSAGDDEDDADSGPSPIGSGWGEFKKKRASSGDFPDDLKITDEAVLIAFVDNEPFAVYRQHWIERVGKKSFVCIEKDCPLCEAGDNRPRVLTAFNVIHMEEGKEPALKIWTTAPRLTGQLAALDGDKKTGPLTKGYWSVKRTGTGTKTAYNISPVKERDLAEDWGVEPLSEDDFAHFEANAYDSSAITFNTKRQLAEVAAEISED